MTATRIRYTPARGAVSYRVSELVGEACGVRESSAENRLNRSLTDVIQTYRVLTHHGRLVERDRRFNDLYDVVTEMPPAHPVRETVVPMVVQGSAALIAVTEWQAGMKSTEATMTQLRVSRHATDALIRSLTLEAKCPTA